MFSSSVFLFLLLLSYPRGFHSISYILMFCLSGIAILDPDSPGPRFSWVCLLLGGLLSLLSFPIHSILTILLIYPSSLLGLHLLTSFVSILDHLDPLLLFSPLSSSYTIFFSLSLSSLHPLSSSLVFPSHYHSFSLSQSPASSPGSQSGSRLPVYLVSILE